MKKKWKDAELGKADVALCNNRSRQALDTHNICKQTDLAILNLQAFTLDRVKLYT
jgi:hypothetical protein